MENIAPTLIYLVDGDQAYRKRVTSFLKNKRLTRVKEFNSGEDMLKELPNSNPAIIIEDFDLDPERSNSSEVLKKAIEIRPNIKFIFLSGSHNVNVATDAIKLGTFAYVLKDDSVKENILYQLERFRKIRINSGKQIMYSKIKIIGFVIFTILILILLFLDIHFLYVKR